MYLLKANWNKIQPVGNSDKVDKRATERWSVSLTVTYKWEKRHIEQLVSDLTSSFLNEYRPEHKRKDIELKITILITWGLL